MYVFSCVWSPKLHTHTNAHSHHVLKIPFFTFDCKNFKALTNGRKRLLCTSFPLQSMQLFNHTLSFHRVKIWQFPTRYQHQHACTINGVSFISCIGVELNAPRATNEYAVTFLEHYEFYTATANKKIGWHTNKKELVKQWHYDLCCVDVYIILEWNRKLLHNKSNFMCSTRAGLRAIKNWEETWTRERERETKQILKMISIHWDRKNVWTQLFCSRLKIPLNNSNLLRDSNDVLIRQFHSIYAFISNRYLFLFTWQQFSVPLRCFLPLIRILCSQFVERVQTVFYVAVISVVVTRT